jgi:hypothetical protein
MKSMHRRPVVAMSGQDPAIAGCRESKICVPRVCVYDCDAPAREGNANG